MIRCLHTAESNVAIFEDAARSLGLELGALAHDVRADLLAAAERAGGLVPDTTAATGAALHVRSRGQ